MNVKEILTSSMLVCVSLLVRFCMPYPGIEPIAGMLLFLPRTFSRMLCYAFIVASVVLYDGMTAGFGMWTVSVIAAYCLIAVGYRVLQSSSKSISTMMLHGIVMTIAFDIATGLTVGPLFFGQPFVDALVGQIPFTIAHLIGNSLLIFVYNMIVQYSVCMHKEVFGWLGRCEHKQEVGYEANNA